MLALVERDRFIKSGDENVDHPLLLQMLDNRLSRGEGEGAEKFR